MIVVRDRSAALATGGAAWLRSSSMTFVSARGRPACQAVDLESQVHTLCRYAYLLTVYSVDEQPREAARLVVSYGSMVSLTP